MDSSRKPRKAPRAGQATAPAVRPANAARTARRATGNWNPDWEPFATLDPSWTEKVVGLTMAPTVSGVLEPKTVELIGVALAASLAHLHASILRRHIRRALDLGATKEEITAVLQYASLQGLYSVCLGAPILLEELAAAGHPNP